MKQIGENLREKYNCENYEKLKYLAKRRLGFIENTFDNGKKNSLDIEDEGAIWNINEFEKEFGNVIDNSFYSAIIYEEFLKEYITIFEAKKYIIDMMKEFEGVKNEDIALDQAINKLRKPIEQ